MTVIINSPNMRPRAAAEYLGLAVPTLAKLRMSGAGPRYAKLGRCVRYNLADLDDWLEAKKRASTSERDARAA